MNEPLESALCAYVDILGFRQQIEKLDAEKEATFFYDLSATFAECSARIRKAVGNLERLKFKSFTDNMIVAYSIMVVTTDLSHLCQLLAAYQLSMACKHALFLRGGISIGGMLLDEDMILGKCLLTSVDMEKKIAVTPRIIIGSNLKEKISEERAKWPEQWKNMLEAWLMRDHDGHLFVSYLEALKKVPERGHPPYLVINEVELSMHREQVEKCLENARQEPYVWFKYFWVANYHNDFCERHHLQKHKIAENFLMPKPNNVTH
jgi:hypothetical protein